MSDYTVDWYRTPLSKEQLTALNARSDVRGLIQSLGHLGLLAVTGAGALWAVHTANYWWLIPILYLHGTIAAFMINAVHELVHGTVFRSRWLNTLFVHAFAFIGWINHRAFWASHSEHHKYTLHDPHDREVVLPIRFRWIGFLRTAMFGNPFLIRHNIRGNWQTARGKLHGDWQRHLLEGDPRHGSVRAWSAWMLVGHAAILAGSIAAGWFIAPAFYIVPVLTSLTPTYGHALFWLLNNTQHVGLQEHVNDFRLNCRTIEVNPVFRFLYWHMNYHIEHHMYAAVPCYRLRALHQAIAHELPETPRGLVATWYHILGVIWRQEQDPSYRFVPALPGDEAANPSPTSPTPAAVAPSAASRPRPAAPAATTRVKVWQCEVCGFIYDEAKGMPEDGIAPGTAWADIPDDWSCPDCGVAKAEFEMVEIARATAPAATSAEPLVIVGSGMAGYGLARELRRHDAERPITLITRDGGEAYTKPGLSNALARGKRPGDLVAQRADEIAAELKLEVRRNTAVSAIDREAKRVVTADGELPYGQLVLATGADQLVIPIEGDAADAVLRVNDLDGYRRFRQALPAGGRVLLLGGGLIGCEFANDLIDAGYRVTVVDLAESPLSALLPSELGATMRDGLAERGVDWRLGTSLRAVEHRDGALGITLADGDELSVDVVLSAIGLRPRLALAEAAELAVGRGIQVDAQLRTSDPDIFALGDCAEVDGMVRPFVKPLLAGARALAATLSGTPTAVADETYAVSVKTPACPAVIAHPGPTAAGSWQVEDARCARFLDADGQLRGYALLGERTAEEAELRAALGATALATA